MATTGAAWTQDEERQLRRLAGRMPCGAIACQINRPRMQVYWRMVALGLVQYHGRWSADEDLVLREMAANSTPAAMQRHLRRRSAQSIKHRLHTLGLDRTRLDDLCYSVAEAAVALAAPRSTVAGWIRRGWLTAEAFSPCVETPKHRRWRVPVASVDDLITQHPYLWSVATFPRNRHLGTLQFARPEEWLPLKLASRRVGVCPNTLRAMCRAGSLEHRTFDADIFLHVSVVTAERARRRRVRQLGKAA